MYLIEKLEAVTKAYNEAIEKAHKYFRRGIYTYAEMLEAMRNAEVEMHHASRAIIMEEQAYITVE